MRGETKERVIDWITSPDSCFLIGAGCSLCANKPLIGTLTKNVIDSVDTKIKEEFEKLKGRDGRTATIEDLINYLVRYQSILETVNDTTGHSIQPEWIESSLRDIKKSIVSQIIDKWDKSEVHERFLKRIKGTSPKNSRCIFTLNYDTVIEATLDHLRFHYVDGFRGTQKGWFDPTIFDETPSCDSYFRVFKLHGSINWARETTGHVRRRVLHSEDDIIDPVVVYPSEQKYLQTQFGVYETLMNRFREKLRETGVNNRLISLGYSFNDEHINEAIVDAVKSKGSNLTVIAFVGADEDAGKQMLKLEKLAARCDHRFNAYVGNSTFIGGALDDSDAKELIAEDLWQFEKMVQYIAGGVV